MERWVEKSYRKPSCRETWRWNANKQPPRGAFWLTLMLIEVKYEKNFSKEFKGNSKIWSETVLAPRNLFGVTFDGNKKDKMKTLLMLM